jgi:uncharacterized membrane protein YhaH (DUF805 family)
METETVPAEGAFSYGSVFIAVVFLALLVVPYWKLWTRTGHSGWWALLMLVPLANLVSLWVLAFKDWPALRGPRP